MDQKESSQVKGFWSSPGLIDKEKYEALMERSGWLLWDIEEALNYMFRRSLIGSVYIGRLKEGLVYPKVEEMYWQRPRKRRRKKAEEDTGSPVFVPYPSWDVVALLSMPPFEYADDVLKQFAWGVGRCLDRTGVSICDVKFVVYRGNIPLTPHMAKKWRKSGLLYGVLDKSFCLRFYRRFPERAPKKRHEPAREFLRHIKDRNKPWGTQRVDRPPSIRKMLETGKIIDPFCQLGLDKYYEPISES
jgi:hypothetical protein